VQPIVAITANLIATNSIPQLVIELYIKQGTGMWVVGGIGTHLEMVNVDPHLHNARVRMDCGNCSWVQLDDEKQISYPQVSFQSTATAVGLWQHLEHFIKEHPEHFIKEEMNW
jgi:hypothetical protein